MIFKKIYIKWSEKQSKLWSLLIPDWVSYHGSHHPIIVHMKFEYTWRSVMANRINIFTYAAAAATSFVWFLFWFPTLESESFLECRFRFGGIFVYFDWIKIVCSGFDDTVNDWDGSKSQRNQENISCEIVKEEWSDVKSSQQVMGQILAQKITYYYLSKCSFGI